ncbi:MAG: TIGR01440 family protein [Clostridia bacterium]|nr:TIGR01440 family protein [Clostridia bacterium]
MYHTVTEQAAAAVRELLDVSGLRAGDLFVVGCSSSEIAGGTIGHDSSVQCARAAYAGIAPILAEAGVYLCAQCCEHLNRAIIMERKAAEAYGYEIVSVVPRPKAGGSFATVTWANMTDPVAVEGVAAHAGIDIGGTLIGMHLRRVAVPVRLSTDKIGEARILCARTRPRSIGGERACYDWDTEAADTYRISTHDTAGERL